jgi:hypothetical protein
MFQIKVADFDEIYILYCVQIFLYDEPFFEKIN